MNQSPNQLLKSLFKDWKFLIAVAGMILCAIPQTGHLFHRWSRLKTWPIIVIAITAASCVLFFLNFKAAREHAKKNSQ